MSNVKTTNDVCKKYNLSIYEVEKIIQQHLKNKEYRKQRNEKIKMLLRKDKEQNMK